MDATHSLRQACFLKLCVVRAYHTALTKVGAKDAWESLGFYDGFCWLNMVLLLESGFIPQSILQFPEMR